MGVHMWLVGTRVSWCPVHIIAVPEGALGRTRFQPGPGSGPIPVSTFVSTAPLGQHQPGEENQESSSCSNVRHVCTTAWESPLSFWNAELNRERCMRACTATFSTG